MTIKICEYCDCEIASKKNTMFCDKECQSNWMSTHPCMSCGNQKERNTDFEPYCSKNCKEKMEWGMFRHNLEMILGIFRFGRREDILFLDKLSYSVKNQNTLEIQEYNIDFSQINQE